MHPEDSFTSWSHGTKTLDSLNTNQRLPLNLLWMRNKSVIQPDLKTLSDIYLLNNATMRLCFIIIHSSVFLTDSKMPRTRHKCILKTVSLRGVPAAYGSTWQAWYTDRRAVQWMNWNCWNMWLRQEAPVGRMVVAENAAKNGVNISDYRCMPSVLRWTPSGRKKCGKLLESPHWYRWKTWQLGIARRRLALMRPGPVASKERRLTVWRWRHDQSRAWKACGRSPITHR